MSRKNARYTRRRARQEGRRYRPRMRVAPRQRSVVRFALEPLLTASGRSVRSLAAGVGVHTRTVYRRRHDGLDEPMADRWAVALGLHPSEVWPDWR